MKKIDKRGTVAINIRRSWIVALLAFVFALSICAMLIFINPNKSASAAAAVTLPSTTVGLHDGVNYATKRKTADEQLAGNFPYNDYPYYVYYETAADSNTYEFWYGTEFLGRTNASTKPAFDSNLYKGTDSNGKKVTEAKTADRDVYILLNRDLSTSTTATITGSTTQTLTIEDFKFDNLCYGRGTVILDLGGHTLTYNNSATNSNSRELFSAQGKGDYPRDIKVIVRNGTIKISTAMPLIYSNAWGNAYGGTELDTSTGVTTQGTVPGNSRFFYEFEDLSINFTGYSSNSSFDTINNFLVHCTDSERGEPTYNSSTATYSGGSKIQDGREVELYVDFKGCNFNVGSYINSDSPALFCAKDPNTWPKGQAEDTSDNLDVINSIVRITIHGDTGITNFAPSGHNKIFEADEANGSWVKFQPVNGVALTVNPASSHTADMTYEKLESPGYLGTDINTNVPEMLSFLKDTDGRYRMYVPVETAYSPVRADQYDKYNFVVFNTDNEVIYFSDIFSAPGDENNFTSAFGYCVRLTENGTDDTGHYKALMTKAFVRPQNSDGEDANSRFANLSYFKGTFTLDLNGGEYYMAGADGDTNEARFINLEAKTGQLDADVTHRTQIIVKNGTLTQTNGSFVYAGAYSKYCQDEHTSLRTMGADFENITFQFAENCSAGAMLVDYGDYSASEGAVAGLQAANGKPMTANLKFANCEFDLTNYKGTTLFNANDVNYAAGENGTRSGYVNSTMNITVVGSTVRATGILPAGFTFMDVNNNNGSSISLIPGADGSYLNVEYNIGNTVVPDALFAAPATIGGNANALGYMSNAAAIGNCTDIDHTLWSYGKLSQNSTTVKYYPAAAGSMEYLNTDGTAETASVLAMHISNPDAFPYLVFADGEHRASYSTWNTAISESAAIASSTLRVVRDVSPATAEGGVLTLGMGALTIDLGNNTVNIGSGGSSAYMLDLTATGDGNIDVYIKNGNVSNLGENAPIRIAYAASYAGNATVNFNMDGVSFTAGRSTLGALFKTDEGNYASATGGKKVNVNATFKNCVVTDNYTTETSHALLTLGSVSNGTISAGDVVKYNITFDGGELVTNRNSFILKNSDDTITFIKTGDSYTRAVMSVSDAPIHVINTAEGKGAFVLESKGDNSTTYVATPAPDVIDSVKTKSNVTFTSGIVYNVYVPKNDSITKFVVGDKLYSTYNFNVLKVVTLSDGEYYMASIPLSAMRGAKTIELDITADVQGTPIAIHYNLSIHKYAEIAETNGLSENEKTLIIDMLAYLKSAYEYFGTDVTYADEYSSLCGVLSELGAASSFSKLGTQYSDSFSGLDKVEFYLSAVPVIRFYLANGFTYDEFVFTANNGTTIIPFVKGVDSNGREYMETSMYAYAMLDSISYTSRNGTTVTYHIDAYYDYVTSDSYAGSDKAELVEVVERFYMYCQSAKVFKG